MNREVSDPTASDIYTYHPRCLLVSVVYCLPVRGECESVSKQEAILICCELQQSRRHSFGQVVLSVTHFPGGGRETLQSALQQPPLEINYASHGVCACGFEWTPCVKRVFYLLSSSTTSHCCSVNDLFWAVFTVKARMRGNTPQLLPFEAGV